MKLPWLVILMTASLLLAGCSSTSDDDEEEIEDRPVEELYNEAMDSFEASQYTDAVEKFEQVEQQYPYSEWAQRAQLMAAYASYQKGDYDNSAAMLDRFIKLYPASEKTAYAYYLKALSFYDQISDIGRDQKMTEEAMVALRDVVARFPESDYARDARMKLDLVSDHLAGKEMEIGRYYLKHGDHVAAINRFKYVLDNYETTSHSEEALHRLVETYLSLGIEPEARRYGAVLGHNFPDSPWYRDSYALLEGESSDLPPPQREGIWDRITTSFD